MSSPRIVVTVSGDGQVSAETLDILGEECLNYIAVLEDLIGGKVRHSAWTADYTRQAQHVQEQQVNRDVDPA
ncbi:hypothetical protein ACWT_2691 [Actinoplanes sp. SE50]|uniref:DUF2997 domain-containing protein n=1 Tax=unclassified Actinoplanes TaxID=2626549 RepID=UPI00023ECAFE|nr:MULTISPECIES: DUF2997 domain-containing protein [unclassified Actinoplanes]AEV83750.1 hypothetical protein ACPL_2855 [Actinoplanes sp. SE50/110]ATO82106.1 hypothetical protein ACWT_2691 [Actinoplanes sp. SE50]SLL99513.1 hypothetical protein ACSP50_2744 [Actinoplanes sp. SE50/110]